MKIHSIKPIKLSIGKTKEILFPVSDRSDGNVRFFICVAMVTERGGSMLWEDNKLKPRRLLMIKVLGSPKYFLWTFPKKGKPVIFFRKLKVIRQITQEQVEQHYGIH